MTDFSAITVLVIEDQEFVRKIAVQFLKQIGCAAVIEAADGEEGFAACVEARPDVAICDVNMKPVDGFAFVERVRTDRNSPNPHMPVIFLSGSNVEGAEERAEGLGANGYLSKPVKPDQLRAMLESVLDG